MSDTGAAADLGNAIRRYQAAVTDYDRETARLLGVNESDLRCLEILLFDEEQAQPSLLASRLGISTGSMTIMIDRLEKLGYLVRAPHPTDRRKTLVRATREVAERARDLRQPLMYDAQRSLLNRFSSEQIATVTSFLTQAEELQQRHVEQLRAFTPARNKRARAAGEP